METLINPIELLIQINAKLDRIEERLRKFDASEYFEKSKILNTDETCVRTDAYFKEDVTELQG